MAIKPRIRVKAGSQRTENPVGRPLSIEGESFVVDGEIVRSFLPAKNGGVEFLPVDDLINRKGWKIYRDMRHDDQIKATLTFKKILVHGRSWELKPAEADNPDAERIAKFVKANLEGINFKRVVREALSALDFGFSLGEIIFDVREWEGNKHLMLDGIKHRDPSTIKIIADKHGNITEFVQEGSFGEHIRLKPMKVWHYAHQSEFQNHYGVSDLRAAYRNWWAKKFIINFWNVFLERLGAPMTLMKYPLGASDELKRLLKGILTGLSAKSEILVPEGVEVELVEATRSGQASYAEALQYHDNAISRALLVIALLGAGGSDVSRGADSQSRLHLRILFKMADELGKDLMDTFAAQVIKPLVDMNFEHDGLYPTFIWQDYGEFEGIEVADTIRLLHAAGIVDMDQEDVNYARSILGLPLRKEGDPEDEVVRPQPLPPPADPNKPPPAADQGNQRTDKGPGGNRATDVDGGKK
jgi:phage gp29-like protein